MHSSTQNTHADLPKQEGLRVICCASGTAGKCLGNRPEALPLYICFSLLRFFLRVCCRVVSLCVDVIFLFFFFPLNTSALYLRVASSCALLCGKSHALKINGYVDMSPGKQPSMTSCWSWQPCALGGGDPKLEKLVLVTLKKSVHML